MGTVRRQCGDSAATRSIVRVVVKILLWRHLQPKRLLRLLPLDSILDSVPNSIPNSVLNFVLYSTLPISGGGRIGGVGGVVEQWKHLRRKNVGGLRPRKRDSLCT